VDFLSDQKLGPILFNFYISDIPHATNTYIAIFADDTTIDCEASDTHVIISHNRTPKTSLKNFSMVQKMANNLKPIKKTSSTFFPL